MADEGTYMERDVTGDLDDSKILIEYVSPSNIIMLYFMHKCNFIFSGIVGYIQYMFMKCGGIRLFCCF